VFTSLAAVVAAVAAFFSLLVFNPLAVAVEGVRLFAECSLLPMSLGRQRVTLLELVVRALQQWSMAMLVVTRRLQQEVILTRPLAEEAEATAATMPVEAVVAVVVCSVLVRVLRQMLERLAVAMVGLPVRLRRVMALMRSTPAVAVAEVVGEAQPLGLGLVDHRGLGAALVAAAADFSQQMSGSTVVMAAM
jgi:hypothetical protein